MLFSPLVCLTYIDKNKQALKYLLLVNTIRNRAFCQNLTPNKNASSKTFVLCRCTVTISAFDTVMSEHCDFYFMFLYKCM